MRSSLRHYMSEAVIAYEEKPREQWLFDYPAQVSLCGTQIWWTTEVNIAFGRLEEVIDLILTGQWGGLSVANLTINWKKHSSNQLQLERCLIRLLHISNNNHT